MNDLMGRCLFLRAPVRIDKKISTFQKSWVHHSREISKASESGMSKT